MRIRHPRTWKTFALAAGLIGPASATVARAEITLIETADVVPTSVVELPRRYYVPTSYTATSVILPSATSAVVYGLSPTSYVATTAYAPTVYYPTAYVYRGRRARRFVETSYLIEPTAALTPTYYPVPTVYAPTIGVSPTSICCESAPPPAAQPAPARGPRVEAVPERPREGAIESSSVGEPEDQGLEPASATRNQSQVPPKPTPVRPSISSAPTGASGTTAPPKGVVKEPKPTAPVQAPKGATPAASEPRPASEGATPPPRPELEPEVPAIPPPTTIPPPAGAADDPLGFPKGEEGGRRSSLKPVVPPVGSNPSARNVLRGRLVSADSRRPEAGVEIVLSDRRGRFLDRTTRTDADGRFAIDLPEGDWSILVTMPSGRALAVEQGTITASAGRVNDRWGRELTNLVISR